MSTPRPKSHGTIVGTPVYASCDPEEPSPVVAPVVSGLELEPLPPVEDPVPFDVPPDEGEELPDEGVELPGEVLDPGVVVEGLGDGVAVYGVNVTVTLCPDIGMSSVLSVTV
jgi:hypothetical protein